MPAVTQERIDGLASCRDGRCAGYKQAPIVAVRTTTAFSYEDLGGDIPGIERESVLIAFEDEGDIPCPVCGEPRLIADQTRPIYPNVSGQPQDALLHTNRDSERVADMQLDNAKREAEMAQMRALMERQSAAMERQESQIDRLSEELATRPRRARKVEGE